MKDLILKNNDDWAGTVARVTVGFILLPHGLQKTFGLFGGFGFSGTMNFFTETLHIPWIFSFMVIVIEFVGAISLLLGFASRIWAGLAMILMIGIILSSHINNGFFMNWFGNQKGEGFEFHLLMIGLCIVLIVNGGGKLAVDQWLAKKLKSGNN